MKAHEIMTRSVVTVSPETPVREIAQVMTEKHISGVPVVAQDGTVIGIVSESDLLRRAEIGTAPTRKWWLSFFSDPDALARQYRKTHGFRAEDIMSHPVVSVREETDLSEIAITLEKRRVKRLPVLRDGKLVGIISRADLVRALSRTDVTRPKVSDTELEKVLLDKIRAQDWLDGTYLDVAVRDGVVELNGFIGSDEQRRALRVLIDELDGVHKVNDQLVVGTPGVGAT